MESIFLVQLNFGFLLIFSSTDIIWISCKLLSRVWLPCLL